MRGACACAVVCALVAVCGALDAQSRELAERQLLALMGLERRPPAAAAPRARPAVPRAMRQLYEGSIPRAAANTVRSFHHRPSALDRRFPNDHRFRLFFDLSAVPADEKARGSDLVLHRAKGVDGDQRLLVYDIVRPGLRGRSGPILKLLDSVPLRPGEEAVTADALSATRRWLAEPEHNHGLLVRILQEDGQGTDARTPHLRVRREASEPESDWRDVQPLLLLYTEDSRAREAREKSGPPLSRMRRATTQSSSRRSRRPHRRHKEAREICQRRPLFVDFADVGWSDWIVAPQGYEAFYCQGDCPFPLTDHLNGTNHAIVQTLVNSVNPATVPKACCVPTQLSSISMLYMDEKNMVVLKNYQDMAVVGCGCR